MSVDNTILAAMYRQIFIRNGNKMPTNEESMKWCLVRSKLDNSVVELYWKGSVVLRGFPNYPSSGNYMYIEFGMSSDGCEDIHV